MNFPWRHADRRATISCMERQDEDLMRDVQQGRLASFDDIVHRYRGPLLRAAGSKLADAAAAEDVVQETFLAVFAARHSYRPELPFRTWLWTILLNLCKRDARRRARHPSMQGTDDPGEVFVSPQHPAAPGSLQQLLLVERREQLRLALERLPEAQADALRLRFFGGLKFEEIAAAMESSVNGAKVRVKQGLIRLASLLPLSEEQEP